MPDCQQVITNLANETWEELGSPTAVSANYILSWYNSAASIGKLNNTLNACYSIVGGYISPVLGDEESAIYKELFKISYYDRQVSAATNSALTDSWIELKDDVSSIKRHNKNEVAKTLILLRKDSYDTIKDMVYAYQQNNSAARFVNMGENNEINPYSSGDSYSQSYNRDR